ncbi:hypothetical protein ACW9HW_04395 [Pseudomonas sp. SDO5532_S415]
MTTKDDEKLLKIKASQLYYTDYSKKAVPGDDPNKTKEDAKRLSRYEEYEVVDMINSIKWTDNKYSLNDLLIIEWMIHEKLPSTTQGAEKVRAWVYAEFKNLKDSRPARLKP